MEDAVAKGAKLLAGGKLPGAKRGECGCATPCPPHHHTSPLNGTVAYLLSPCPQARTLSVSSTHPPCGGDLPLTLLSPYLSAGKDTVGQFYPPTVLLGVKRGMKIWEEEVFGPVRGSGREGRGGRGRGCLDPVRERGGGGTQREGAGEGDDAIYNDGSETTPPPPCMCR